MSFDPACQQVGFYEYFISAIQLQSNILDFKNFEFKKLWISEQFWASVSLCLWLSHHLFDRDDDYNRQRILDSRENSSSIHESKC